jgi:amino acid adenylation domain-containing protein
MERTLYGWFAHTVSEVPEQLALVAGGRELTYAELDTVVRVWARRLRPPGAHPPRVGLVAARTVATYAAYLATLRAGGTVVPLNVTSPPERLGLIAASARLDLLVIDGSGDNPLGRDSDIPALRLGDDDVREALTVKSVDEDASRGRPEDFAYVLFTSGSTGRPKGVPLRHRNLDAFLRHHIARYQVGPGCRLSQTFDLTFDPSVFDMFVAWGAGATLVVPSREELYEPSSFVRRNGITHWYSVPSLVSISHAAGALPPGAMPSLRWSLFAGEQLTLEQAGQWAAAAPGSTVENLYGPTELAVTVTAYRLPRDPGEWPRTSNGTVPIGPIYPHLEHLVTDEGELLVRGPQRFDGYLDPADDHGRFVGEPPAAGAWYRTGDRVAVENGDLVHLGRIDNQLKIHGQRVELGEIEATLRTRLGISEVVVVNAPGASGEPRLVAVYRGEPVPSADLRARLRSDLPPYMIPKRYVHVDRLPLNANGKVDRGACRSLATRSQPVPVG